MTLEQMLFKFSPRKSTYKRLKLQKEIPKTGEMKQSPENVKIYKRRQ